MDRSKIGKQNGKKNPLNQTPSHVEANKKNGKSKFKRIMCKREELHLYVCVILKNPKFLKRVSEIAHKVFIFDKIGAF